tara:strand:+ start:46521 stop:46631 length:111 start_codon:yes stop_codon:yes gene_type:complete
MAAQLHMDDINLKYQFWIQAAGLAGAIIVVSFLEEI